MKNIKSLNLSMMPGELQKLRGPKNQWMSIRCVTGTLWVTTPGDPTDYILNAGEEIKIKSQGREILVQSLATRNESQIQLCA